MNNQRISEKGQAIVFLVVGLVVFLGFVGLAIDGGMAYSDRRHAQNSADAAALAAAGTIALTLDNNNITYNTANFCTAALSAAQSAGETSAVNRAAANNFGIDADYSDWNGVDIQCHEIDYGYIDRVIEVTVRLSDTTTTAFAHLLFPEALSIRTEAVTWVRPPMPLVYGNAVVALNPVPCTGMDGAGFHGGSNLQVSGGGVWSNGCMRGDGGPVVTIDPPGPEIHYRYTPPGGIGGTFTPPPTSTNLTLPPDSYTLPAPNCDGRWFNAAEVKQLANKSNPNQGLHGLYCINTDSGDLHVSGNGYFTGREVTIYMPNNDIIINATITVDLTAPPDGASPAIPGILIHMPASNDGVIRINGTADSNIQGTIMAPGASVDVTGCAGFNAFRSQVIGWNVEIGGTGDAGVVFNEEEQYRKPASLELAR